MPDRPLVPEDQNRGRTSGVDGSRLRIMGLFRALVLFRRCFLPAGTEKEIIFCQPWFEEFPARGVTIWQEPTLLLQEAT